MISNISMKGVTSFSKDGLDIRMDKRVNLFYGLNGSGKSTIANYLSDTQDNDFKRCSLTSGEKDVILVYGKKFIDDNFANKEGMAGVFTLSRSNVDAEQADPATLFWTVS